MPQSLLEISDDMKALDDLLSEVGGDVSDPRVEQVITAWANELQSSLHHKVDNYAALISTLEHRAESRAAESARLSKRAKIDAATAEQLRLRLMLHLQNLGIKRLETPRYKITVANNGGALPLVIADAGTVPPQFWKEIPASKELDKDAIRRAIEAGQAVPGACLGSRGTNLKIN
jgi:hypothetical protein